MGVLPPTTEFAQERVTATLSLPAISSFIPPQKKKKRKRKEVQLQAKVKKSFRFKEITLHGAEKKINHSEKMSPLRLHQCITWRHEM